MSERLSKLQQIRTASTGQQRPDRNQAIQRRSKSQKLVVAQLDRHANVRLAADGVTDDTVAVQRAIDTATGGLELPPGDILVSNTIRLAAGTRLQGQGAGKTGRW